MRALIAGAGGQLGRALAASVPDGITAVALDRNALDVADPASVQAAFEAHRPELLINASAFTAVDLAETRSADAYLGNCEGPRLLAREAASRGTRLVHVSTDFVFDGEKSSPYQPDDATAPTGVYGASKRAGEQAVGQADPRALTVRTSWVYAATGKNFLVTMLRLMRERGAVRVVADQIGTPTHAASLARALWSMAASDAAGIVHYADAGTAAWYDFAVAIAEEALGAGLLDAMPTVEPIATTDFPTPVKRPPYSVLDRTSGWRLTGRPRHWRAELRDAITKMKAAAI